MKFTVLVFTLIFFVSGCLNSEPPPPPGQQIDTSSEKKEDISQEAKIEFENDTGIVVKDITIKPKGTLGGDIVFLVQNESDEECGFVIQVDMLSDTDELIVSVGVNSPTLVGPGEEMEIKGLFIGKGAVKAEIKSINCDNMSSLWS